MSSWLCKDRFIESPPNFSNCIIRIVKMLLIVIEYRKRIPITILSQRESTRLLKSSILPSKSSCKPKGIFFFKKVVVGELKNRVREREPLELQWRQKISSPLSHKHYGKWVSMSIIKDPLSVATPFTGSLKSNSCLGFQTR